MKTSREMFEDRYKNSFGNIGFGFNKTARNCYMNETLQTLWEGFFAAYDLIQSELDAVKAENEKLYAAKKEWSRVDCRTFGSLALENERLNKLLAKEFNENDELGLEYTGIVLLKEALAKEKAAAAKLVECLQSASDFIHKSGQDCTMFELALSEYKARSGNE